MRKDFLIMAQGNMILAMLNDGFFEIFFLVLSVFTTVMYIIKLRSK